jgi:diaminopimelate decarboxylase
MSTDRFLPHSITRERGILHVEQCSLSDLAEQFGTPCYVYSKAAITAAYTEFTDAFAGQNTLICYAVKANGNLGLLGLLSSLGAGFDIVSGGELARVLAAGGSPQKIVFSGIGKSAAEMKQALRAGILCFNVESAAELRRLSQLACSMGLIAPISLRVNPDVDAQTHPYIATGLKDSKFGIAYGDAFSLYEEAAALPGIVIHGIDCHIGSQITELSPFVAALKKVLALMERLKGVGITLQHVDLGGGVGIRYRDESPLHLADYAKAIRALMSGFAGRLLLEPGRRIVGNGGLLLTRVEYLKSAPEREFAVVDAAMNDLIRPALYQAWHEIVPVVTRSTPERILDVVGPVCESGDILGSERSLSLEEGDLLAILSAGAYGSSMGSNYNARSRPPEILVDGHSVTVIRRGETFADQIRNEIPTS